MFRLLISQWASLLIARTLPGLNERNYSAASHRAILRARLARDTAFADSGFWDFALLTAYDQGVRRVVLGGVTALSEFGWTERALIGSSQALNFAPAATPLSTLRNLGSVFSHLGMNLAFALAGLGAMWAAAAGSLTAMGPLNPAAVSYAVRAQVLAPLCADIWFPVERRAALEPFLWEAPGYRGGAGKAAAPLSGPSLRGRAR